MLKQKFKNPMVNNQYKKPACHTDYCFQRRACCNNYRCCVCHCCLDDFQYYSKSFDRCVGNITEAKTKGKTKMQPIPTHFTTTRSKYIENTKLSDAKPRTRKEETTKKLFFFAPTSSARSRTKAPALITTRRLGYEVKTTWQTRKTTFKMSNSKGTYGRRSDEQDDKTSTIAGVAVALALVAIVAIVILLVLCSRRKKRKRNKVPKADTSASDAAVVTIPLTIENVNDKFRDGTEEGTTSDTTIDSSTHPTSLTKGKHDSQHTNGTHLETKPAVNGNRKHGKKHKRSSKHTRNEQAEQHRLFNDEMSHTCNGGTEQDARQSTERNVALQHAQGHYLNNKPCNNVGHHPSNRLPFHSHNGSIECAV